MKNLFSIFLTLSFCLSFSASLLATQGNEVKLLKQAIKMEESRILDEATGLKELLGYDGVLKARKMKIASLRKAYSYGFTSKEEEKIKKLSEHLTQLKLIDGRAGKSDMKGLDEYMRKTFADGSRGQVKFFEYDEEDYSTDKVYSASNI